MRKFPEWDLPGDGGHAGACRGVQGEMTLEPLPVGKALGKDRRLYKIGPDG